MSWSTSGAGRASDVAAKIAKDLTYGEPGNMKGAIAGVAAAIARVNPELLVTFETSGRVEAQQCYGTVTFKTYQPAPTP